MDGTAVYIESFEIMPEPLIDRDTAIWCITLSFLALVGGVTFALMCNRILKKKRLSLTARLWIGFGSLASSVFILRLMVGLSGVLGEKKFIGAGAVFDSLVHTLQTFSMDEDYTEYVETGTKMLEILFGETDFLPAFYNIYSAALNFICPIAAGGFLLSLVTRFLPKFRLWMRLHIFGRRSVHCYFSELNDASLALAKSIKEHDSKLQNANIIFLDVYPDTDDEAVSERIEQAARLGAICMMDDILGISFRKKTNKKIFLMDRVGENEIGNLQTFAGFTDTKVCEKLHAGDEIYLFCQSDSNILVEREVSDIFKRELGENNVPVVIPVKSYRNLICNLLTAVPLYTALDRGNDDGVLSVTIFGSGLIGTEMFLDTYWCGQLLDYTLSINVVSMEKESDFIARIDHINPEIFETRKPDSELLRIYSGSDERAPVYFHFEYYETNIRKDDLSAKLKESRGGKRLIDSDYFVVALGSDEENLEIAELLGRFVTADKPSVKKKIPVAYAIYDDGLAKVLGTNGGDDKTSVMMCPFGSLGETYNYSKIVLEGIRESAERISDIYNKAIIRKTADNKTLIYDQYTYWANIARAIHMSYKAFCMGLDTDSYYQAVTGKAGTIKERDRNRLAWLEHRRWCAFMRTRGFRAPTREEEAGYISQLPDAEDGDTSNWGKHKNRELKLHPCLVEDDDLGKRDIFAEGAKIDRLDEVLFRIKTTYKSKNLRSDDDFKTADFPDWEFREFEKKNAEKENTRKKHNRRLKSHV